MKLRHKAQKLVRYADKIKSMMRKRQLVRQSRATWRALHLGSELDVERLATAGEVV